MWKFILQSISVVVGIGLLGTAPALADPLTVTTGPVTALPGGGGTFTLAGEGFSLTGAPTFPGYASTLWDCMPCRASDGLTLSLSSSVAGSFDDGLPGEFDYVLYDQTWLAICDSHRATCRPPFSPTAGRRSGGCVGDPRPTSSSRHRSGNSGASIFSATGKSVRKFIVNASA